MNFSIEINQAVEWTVRLVSVCILIDTVEKFYNFREFRDKGIFSWEWIKQFPGFSQRRQIIRKFADFVFGFPTWFVLITLRGLAALWLLFVPGQSLISTIGILVIFIVGSLANFRRMPYAPQAPNRFTLIIIGALFLQSIVPSKIVTEACLWFIALQSCLSYATAGITKLFNKDWRNGTGVLRVVNTPNLLASPNLAEFFRSHGFIGKVLNYFTIAIESLFPFVLFIGKPFFFVFLIWGLFFHLTNAVLLRFNNYFWAWIATYPAIIYVAHR